MVRNPRKLATTLSLMFSQLYKDPGGKLKYQLRADSSRALTNAFANVTSSPPADMIAASYLMRNCLGLEFPLNLASGIILNCGGFEALCNPSERGESLSIMLVVLDLQIDSTSEATGWWLGVSGTSCLRYG